MRFNEKLKTIHACDEAVEWVGQRGLRKAWAECERSDWMIWLACECQEELGITDRQLHEIACDCAERALQYVPDGEDRPRIAIMTKRRWIRGDATDEELSAAGSAAGSAAWSAARDAARSAGSARYAARSAGYAAGAACSAAESAERDIQRKQLIRMIEADRPAQPGEGGA